MLEPPSVRSNLRLVGQPFSGSEDFAFDGRGHIVGRVATAVVRREAATGTTTSRTSRAGLRPALPPEREPYRGDPQVGEVVTLSPTGQVRTFHRARSAERHLRRFRGNTLFTEFSGNKVLALSRTAPKTLISGRANAKAPTASCSTHEEDPLLHGVPEGQSQRLSARHSRRAPSPSRRSRARRSTAWSSTHAATSTRRQGARGSSAFASPLMERRRTPELLATFAMNVAERAFRHRPRLRPEEALRHGQPGHRLRALARRRRRPRSPPRSGRRAKTAAARRSVPARACPGRRLSRS